MVRGKNRCKRLEFECKMMILFVNWVTVTPLGKKLVNQQIATFINEASFCKAVFYDGLIETGAVLKS